MMTKKILRLLVAASTLAGFLVAGGITVNADDASSSSSSSSPVSGTSTTTANVTLNAESFSGDSSDGNTNGLAGGIKLQSVPGFQFGTQTIDTSTSEAHYVTANTLAPVTVINPGIATGWNVTVASGPMTSTNGDVLKASNLNLTAGSPTSETTDNNADATANMPTFSNVILNTDGSSGNVPVATAAVKSGLGTWNMPYTNATLNVAQNNLASTYTSNLTWTLTNAPSGAATTPAS